MIPKTTNWKLDPHTKAKHVILRKYLDAWFPILTRWHGRVVFCDGFAGPGVYKDGEDGSPVIAIKAYLEHAHRQKIDSKIAYLFIEEDEQRYDSLVAVLNGLKPALPKNITIETVRGEYNEAFSGFLDYLDEHNLAIAPTFAFIDPFGIKGLPLKTIARLMRHERTEVLINFMVGPLTRFISTPEFPGHCDELFGCSDWRDALEMDGNERESFFRALYQLRLLDDDTGVGAKYVRFFTMKDHRKKAIYDLFFATNHPRGIDAMKDAMWKVDQSGEYLFSDATNPNQEVLFSLEPDWERLINTLQKQFGGQRISWQIVEEAIRNSPYRILKKPIQKAAKEDNPRIAIHNLPGTRANTLNDHTEIAFRRLL